MVRIVGNTWEYLEILKNMLVGKEGDKRTLCKEMPLCNNAGRISSLGC